jgi:hypothetical protein
LPLQTAEDAAVAAVRLGYRVVDAQIERGLDMARRLRGAADRAGAGDPRDVLDSAERLLSRGLLLGVESLEAFANTPGSPLRRLLTAQFRLLASFFGVDAGRELRGAESRFLESLLGLNVDEALARAAGTSKRHEGDTTTQPPAGRPALGARTVRHVRIRHSERSSQRAVSVVRFELYPPFPRTRTIRPLQFHYVSDKSAQRIAATLSVAPQEPPVLEVTTTDETSGRWRAAICQDDGEQVGIVEIEL